MGIPSPLFLLESYMFANVFDWCLVWILDSIPYVRRLYRNVRGLDTKKLSDIFLSKVTSRIRTYNIYLNALLLKHIRSTQLHNKDLRIIEECSFSILVKIPNAQRIFCRFKPKIKKLAEQETLCRRFYWVPPDSYLSYIYLGYFVCVCVCVCVCHNLLRIALLFF